MARTQAEYGIHEYVIDNQATMDEEAFNDVDGLVLTQVAMMDFSTAGIDIGTGVSKTIAEIYEEIKDTEVYENMSEDNQKLLANLAASTRFQDMVLSNYVVNPVKNEVEGFASVGEESATEQFGAVAITYTQQGETIHFLAFQATDSSIDGWNEDLLMLACACTQAQADAVSYLNLVAGELSGTLTGGGHSKGGNNFEYGYLFCEEEVRARIAAGYLYDSPGLYEDIVEGNENYESFLAITQGHYYCPQDSIIGLILHECENASFVYSAETGFNEHDPYSWEVCGSTFVSAEQTWVSKFVDEVSDLALIRFSMAQREALYAVVNYIFYCTGGEETSSLSALFGEGWQTEKGRFNLTKLGEVLSVFLDDWAELSISQRWNFVQAVGVIIGALLVISASEGATRIERALSQKLDAMETAISQKLSAVETAISQKMSAVEAAISHQLNAMETILSQQLGVVEAALNSLLVVAKDWTAEKLLLLKDFLSAVSSSVASVVGQAKAYCARCFSGSVSGNTGSDCLEVKTAKMQQYAANLRRISASAKSLDNRMNQLYWQLGIDWSTLANLARLLKSGVLLDYASRLDACASYLEQTASAVESAERRVAALLV